MRPLPSQTLTNPRKFQRIRQGQKKAENNIKRRQRQNKQVQHKTRQGPCETHKARPLCRDSRFYHVAVAQKTVPKWNPVSGNIDQNLRHLSCLILSHTHVSKTAKGPCSLRSAALPGRPRWSLTWGKLWAPFQFGPVGVCVRACFLFLLTS